MTAAQGRRMRNRQQQNNSIPLPNLAAKCFNNCRQTKILEGGSRFVAEYIFNIPNLMKKITEFLKRT